MRSKLLMIMIVGCGLSAHSQHLPLVYEQEHTGKHYAAPEMLGYDQLPECRELPDRLAWSNGLGRVSEFKDWARRRSEIAAWRISHQQDSVECLDKTDYHWFLETEIK